MAANPAATAADPAATAANLRDSAVNPEVAMVANPEVATANPEAVTAAPEADMEAARKATEDSKTTATAVAEKTAAMALPEAVQVMVVDMVESAPTAVDLNPVPVMEAHEDGEELSFCVYGLIA